VPTPIFQAASNIPAKISQPAPQENNLVDQDLRNQTIQELNQQAEKALPPIDNHTGLNIYYHMAQQWWEQGNLARKTGDLDTAYVCYMKFTTFVLEKLPGHLSYQNSKFADDKTSARAKCIKVLKELENIQAQIVPKRKEKNVTENPELTFPQVPTSIMFPSVPTFQMSQNNP